MAKKTEMNDLATGSEEEADYSMRTIVQYL